MYTATQILLHFIGDYWLQSDWMAANKQRKDARGWFSVTAHAITYTLPFCFLTQAWMALAVICISHLLIDHYKVAAFLGWAKNMLAPRSDWKPWADCKGTGYASDKPPFIAVWLMIIKDNTLHILINGAAIHYLGG